MNAEGLADITALAEEQGLRLRGAFLCKPEDDVPPQADGSESRTLVLLGNLGGSLWPVFSASPESRDGQPDPMNRWSSRIITALPERIGGRAVFPFGGPPYHPFLRWARRAEGLAASPLGMLIHPEFGLWHAYRGGIAFGRPLTIAPVPKVSHPCEDCVGRPCLSACPVNAFTPSGYDVPACSAHLASTEGEDCLSAGCLARRACPVGAEHYYGASQAAFHMSAFLAAQTAKMEP